MGTILSVVAFAIATFAIAEGRNSMNKPQRTSASAGETRGVEPLFKAVRQYQAESQADAVIAAERHEGAYIGSGDGTVTGGRLREGLHLCTMNPTGFIETHDGARIRFDGRGYGLHSPKKYQTSLTLMFGTEDARYAWITKILAVMEGEFDEKAGRAVWNVYIPRDEPMFRLSMRSHAPVAKE
jgi:hypothetical protein